MMAKNRMLLMILISTIATIIAGCEKSADVASPNCADLDKITNPVQKAELLKTCPRGGAAFKPSDKKSW
jgi:entry exclusion lipoprotein TrbK